LTRHGLGDLVVLRSLVGPLAFSFIGSHRGQTIPAADGASGNATVIFSGIFSGIFLGNVSGTSSAVSRVTIACSRCSVDLPKKD